MTQPGEAYTLGEVGLPFITPPQPYESRSQGKPTPWGRWGYPSLLPLSRTSHAARGSLHPGGGGDTLHYSPSAVGVTQPGEAYTLGEVGLPFITPPQPYESRSQGKPTPWGRWGYPSLLPLSRRSDAARGSLHPGGGGATLHYSPSAVGVTQPGEAYTLGEVGLPFITPPQP